MGYPPRLLLPVEGSPVQPSMFEDHRSSMHIELYDNRRTTRNVIYAGDVMDDVVEPAAEDMLLPKMLAALADPHRLASVRFLARNGESWCSQVMQEAGLELSKSTFSHHLRILREAGLVTKRIQGAKGYAQLRKQDVDGRFPGLLDSILNADAAAQVQPRYRTRPPRIRP